MLPLRGMARTIQRLSARKVPSMEEWQLLASFAETLAAVCWNMANLTLPAYMADKE